MASSDLVLSFKSNTSWSHLYIYPTATPCADVKYDEPFWFKSSCFKYSRWYASCKDTSRFPRALQTSRIASISVLPKPTSTTVTTGYSCASNSSQNAALCVWSVQSWICVTLPQPKPAHGWCWRKFLSPWLTVINPRSIASFNMASSDLVLSFKSNTSWSHLYIYPTATPCADVKYDEPFWFKSSCFKYSRWYASCKDTSRFPRALQTSRIASISVLPKPTSTTVTTGYSCAGSETSISPHAPGFISTPKFS